MTLKKYNTKRNFKKTTEPPGKKKKASKDKTRVFVIQKHAARHLHYDLRLEMDGVLKSWAVPKGPCLDPHVKRLAVEVEDHPMEYGNFEGVIPKGEYGAGAVLLWDKGTWEETSDEGKGYKKGHLSFVLKGKKLKGLWTLVRLKGDPENWLLIKVEDKEARPVSEYDITQEKPLSIVSKKPIEKIVINPKNKWFSNKKPSNEEDKTKSKKKESINLEKTFVKLGLEKVELPASIHPQLATLVDTTPKSKDWLHEIKFDGYRLICHIENKIKLMTRNQHDWTRKFPMIKVAMEKLKLKDTILDGEIVALDEKGRSSFQALQNALSEDSSHTPLIYYVFDILYYQGFDLTQLDLLKRKEILKHVLTHNASDIIRYSDHVVGDGDTLFHQACQLSLEGIICKEIHSPYIQKRTKNWLKRKCSNRQEFVIGGFTKPQNSREYFGSLLLGVYSKGKFVYCGHVGTGFDSATLKQLYEILMKNKTKEMPFETVPQTSNVVSWVKPNIIVEVEFTEWTQEGILRHPSFKGLRKDKSAKEIKRETKKAIDKKDSKKEKPLKKSVDGDFGLTHPEKIMFPESKISKLQIAEYYHSIGKWILPYVINRPLALLRCPDGKDAQCFFQKHLNKNDHSNSTLFEGKPSNKNESFIYIKDMKGLLKLVQMGVLEIHPWGSSADKPEKPDLFIFDLDPAPNVPWKKVIEAAFRVKEELEELGLQSFVKTTGGKGLHITIPIQRRYSWEQVNHFSKIFVEYMVSKYPKDYIGTMSKAKRVGKIFIDYLRNHQGATAVAPYSTRSRENATIATPLAWEELTPKIKSTQFTLKTLPKRLAKLKKDPWQDFFKIKQKLPVIK